MEQVEAHKQSYRKLLTVLYKDSGFCRTK